MVKLVGDQRNSPGLQSQMPSRLFQYVSNFLKNAIPTLTLDTILTHHPVYSNKKYVDSYSVIVDLPRNTDHVYYLLAALKAFGGYSASILRRF